MQPFKYCPYCRGELEEAHVDGRHRSRCSSCGWINYRNPLPVVSCLVADKKGGILLIKRGIEPCKGSWALPGGFMEIDETPDEAGERELLEETGLKGKPGRLVGIKIHESRLYGAVLVIGLEFKVKTFALEAGDDAMDARFFTSRTRPKIPFKHQEALVREFLKAISCKI